MTLLVVAVGLTAAGASAQVVLAPSVFRNAQLPADAVTAFAVTCPIGYLAVSGGIFKPADGTSVVALRPTAGARGYTFRVGNPARNSRRHVTALVACRRLGGPDSGPFLKITPLRRGPIVVPPGSLKTAEIDCPHGTAPAGYGVDLQPGRARARESFDGTPLSLRRATADLAGFSFAVGNSGTTVKRAVLFGNCLTVVRPPGSPSERLHVKLTTFSGPVRPGTHKVVHTCPKGWIPLSAGFRLSSSAMEVVGAAAVNKGGSWWVESEAPNPTLVDLQIACGRLEAS
jgi:hypothetical protein